MTIEQAKKLLDEEYERAQKLEWVHNPLAYALYHVWKKSDVERNTRNEVQTLKKRSKNTNERNRS